MATPFDEKAANKLVDAFRNLNSELEESLKNAEDFNAKEQESLNIAKNFNVIFKTKNERFKDSLKSLSLQEQLLRKAENSESELETLQRNRFNSAKNITSSQKALNDLNIKYSATQSGILNLTNDEVNELLNEIKLTENLIKTEQDLLNKSKKMEESLTNQTKAYKFLNKIMLGTQLILKELNIPTSFQELLKQTYDRFKEIDKVSTEIRQKFALFRSDGQFIEDNIRTISLDLAKFGATATDVAGTIKSIGSTFTSIDIADKGVINDITLLSKQMGIASDKSVSFLKTIGGVKGQSGLANKNMLSLAGAAAKAYGVGLDEVMGDVANASEEARMYAGKNADEMVRAAAQARQMGTTLDNMAKTASGLLDFESSIQSELKASALIGKNINFNEARRLAFQGKVVEANKLILDQAKKIKFNQLNPLAQKAFADAAGKSVKELQEMLESETRIKDALNSQDPAVRKIAQERLKEQNLLKTNTKLAQQKFEQDLKTKANQERLTVLQNKINAQLQKLMLPTLELITKAMDKILDLFERFKPEDLIAPLIKVKLIISMFGDIIGNTLKAPFKIISGYMSKLTNITWIQKLISPITNLTSKIKNLFVFLKSNVASTIQKFKNITNFVSSIFSPITNAIKPIINSFKLIGEGTKTLKGLSLIFKGSKLGLKAVPFLGEVIMAIEFAINLWKRFSATWSDKNLNIGQKIFKSVFDIREALFDVLVQPFIDIGKWIIEAVFGEKILNGIMSVTDKISYYLKWPFVKAYEFIMDTLGGKSPSKIGLAIVNGIKSVVDMLFDVLTYPFKKGFQIIKLALNGVAISFKDVFSSSFEFVTQALEKIWERIKGIGQFITTIISKGFNFVGKIIGSPEETVGKSTKTEDVYKSQNLQSDSIINTIVTSNKAIADKLDKLTSLMASGQIAVYIDGQRANQILASTSQKFGSFGQATT